MLRHWNNIFLAYFLIRIHRKTTFRELVVKLYGTTDLCRKGGRGPLFDPCERVGVFMWRMGGGCTVRQTALHFKLSEGTVSQVTLEVAKLAEERLKGEYVHWPSLSEQEEISTQWEREKSLRLVRNAAFPCCFIRVVVVVFKSQIGQSIRCA